MVHLNARNSDKYYYCSTEIKGGKAQEDVAIMCVGWIMIING